jgi:tetratricopeptide (TPR) repeat protein
LKAGGNTLDKENKGPKAGSASTVPFEGELINLAVEMENKGDYKEAEAVLQSAIKWYPNSAGSYRELGRVYTKLGKPAPMNEETIVKLIEDGKIDEALAAYDKVQKQYPGWIVFNEESINMQGYHLMAKKQYDAAIKVFQLNAKAYPKSANAFDSLGEGYMNGGKKQEAIAAYQQSLDMDPSNNNAKEMLARLK